MAKGQGKSSGKAGGKPAKFGATPPGKVNLGPKSIILHGQGVALEARVNNPVSAPHVRKTFGKTTKILSVKRLDHVPKTGDIHEAEKLKLAAAAQAKGQTTLALGALKNAGDAEKAGIKSKRQLLAAMKAAGIPKPTQALKAGIAAEMEHTRNTRVAQEIATDHLVKDPNYYAHLETMEKAGEATVAAQRMQSAVAAKGKIMPPASAMEARAATRRERKVKEFKEAHAESLAKIAQIKAKARERKAKEAKAIVEAETRKPNPERTSPPPPKRGIPSDLDAFKSVLNKYKEGQSDYTYDLVAGIAGKDPARMESLMKQIIEHQDDFRGSIEFHGGARMGPIESAYVVFRKMGKNMPVSIPRPRSKGTGQPRKTEDPVTKIERQIAGFKKELAIETDRVKKGDIGLKIERAEKRLEKTRERAKIAPIINRTEKLLEAAKPRARAVLKALEALKKSPLLENRENLIEKIDDLGGWANTILNDKAETIIKRSGNMKEIEETIATIEKTGGLQTRLDENLADAKKIVKDVGSVRPNLIRRIDALENLMGKIDYDKDAELKMGYIKDANSYIKDAREELKIAGRAPMPGDARSIDQSIRQAEDLVAHVQRIGQPDPVKAIINLEIIRAQRGLARADRTIDRAQKAATIINARGVPKWEVHNLVEPANLYATKVRKLLKEATEDPDPFKRSDALAAANRVARQMNAEVSYLNSIKSLREVKTSKSLGLGEKADIDRIFAVKDDLLAQDAYRSPRGQKIVKAAYSRLKDAYDKVNDIVMQDRPGFAAAKKRLEAEARRVPDEIARANRASKREMQVTQAAQQINDLNSEIIETERYGKLKNVPVNRAVFALSEKVKALEAWRSELLKEHWKGKPDLKIIEQEANREYDSKVNAEMSRQQAEIEAKINAEDTRYNGIINFRKAKVAAIEQNIKRAFEDPGDREIYMDKLAELKSTLGFIVPENDPSKSMAIMHAGESDYKRYLDDLENLARDVEHQASFAARDVARQASGSSVTFE